MINARASAPHFTEARRPHVWRWIAICATSSLSAWGLGTHPDECQQAVNDRLRRGGDAGTQRSSDAAGPACWNRAQLVGFLAGAAFVAALLWGSYRAWEGVHVQPAGPNVRVDTADPAGRVLNAGRMLSRVWAGGKARPSRLFLQHVTDSKHTLGLPRGMVYAISFRRVSPPG